VRDVALLVALTAALTSVPAAPAAAAVSADAATVAAHTSERGQAGPRTPSDGGPQDPIPPPAGRGTPPTSPAAGGRGVLAAAVAAVGQGATSTAPAGGAELAELVVRVRTDLVVADPGRSQVTLTVDGRPLPVLVTSLGGGELRVAAADLPADLQAPVTAPVSHRVGLLAAARDPAAAAVRHVSAAFTWLREPPPTLPAPEGFALVTGDGPVVGSDGPVRTYSLEVEPAAGVDPLAFAAEAEAALSDPRGWTARGDLRLQRVGRADADLRVVLATPATVDAYCARAGLDTNGRYSCWNGRFAMLNAENWTRGAAPFTDPLPSYRAYLVNHEVGHGLGHGHAACPSPGALAPVMVQQTIRVAPCRPNPWPHP